MWHGDLSNNLPINPSRQVWFKYKVHYRKYLDRLTAKFIGLIEERFPVTSVPAIREFYCFPLSQSTTKFCVRTFLSVRTL